MYSILSVHFAFLLLVILCAGCSAKKPDGSITHAGVQVHYRTYTRGVGPSTERLGEVWIDGGKGSIGGLTGCPPYICVVNESPFVIASDDISEKRPLVHFLDVKTGEHFSVTCPEPLGLGIGCDGLVSTERISDSIINIYVRAFSGGYSINSYDVVAHKHLSRQVK